MPLAIRETSALEGPIVAIVENVLSNVCSRTTSEGTAVQDQRWVHFV